jgi:hypothetical protein
MKIKGQMGGPQTMLRLRQMHLTIFTKHQKITLATTPLVLGLHFRNGRISGLLQFNLKCRLQSKPCHTRLSPRGLALKRLFESNLYDDIVPVDFPVTTTKIFNNT